MGQGRGGSTYPRALLIRELYKKLGGNPQDLVINAPEDDFLTSHKVQKKNGTQVIALREDIHRRNFLGIQKRLRKLFSGKKEHYSEVEMLSKDREG